MPLGQAANVVAPARGRTCGPTGGVPSSLNEASHSWAVPPRQRPFHQLGAMHSGSVSTETTASCAGSFPSAAVTTPLSTQLNPSFPSGLVRSTRRGSAMPCMRPLGSAAAVIAPSSGTFRVAVERGWSPPKDREPHNVSRVPRHHLWRSVNQHRRLTPALAERNELIAINNLERERSQDRRR